MAKSPRKASLLAGAPLGFGSVTQLYATPMIGFELMICSGNPSINLVTDLAVGSSASVAGRCGTPQAELMASIVKPSRPLE